MNPTHQPATQPFERLRELEARATPGPWFVVQRDHRLRIHGPYKSAAGDVPSGTGLHKLEAWEGKSGAARGSSPTWRGFTEKELTDFALIAESRNLLPALLDSQAALVAALRELVDAEDASIDQFTAVEIDRIEAAMDKARAALATAEEKPRK